MNTNDPIIIKGTIQFEDYLEAHEYLAKKRRLYVKTVMLLFGTGSIIFGLSSNDTDVLIFSTFIMFFCCIYSFSISNIIFAIKVKKLWNNYPTIQNKFHISIDNNEINFHKEKSISGNKWSDFIKYNELKNVFLLYYSPNLPLIIPKKFIDNNSIEKLRDILSCEFKNK